MGDRFVKYFTSGWTNAHDKLNEFLSEHPDYRIVTMCCTEGAAGILAYFERIK